MKKALIYSAMILLAGAMACSKNDHVLSGEGHILFAPAGIETRALVTNDYIQGETFQVFDFMGTTKYIDETISYNDQTSTWDYASGVDYLWKTGTHKLFGFTAGAGTLGTDQKVTVSKALTIATANQTDLLYSEIVTQDAAEWKKAPNTPDTPVKLNFKHMLAAVSFEIKNETGKAVTLNTVSAPAIKNAGSVTVDYSGTAVSVSEVTFATSTTPFAPGLSNVSLADGASVDGLSGAATPDYFVVWPQALPDGDDALTVAFNYTVGTGTDAATKTANVKLPADTWLAGQKYAFLLTIYPTDVHLIFKVQPWDSGEAGDIDTENGSINMSNVVWMNTKVMVDGVEQNTVNNSSKSVTMWPTSGSSPFVVYETYEEDVPAVDEEGQPVLDDDDNPVILHHKGEIKTYEEDVPAVDDQGQPVLDDEGQPVILHHAGDKIVKEIQTVPYSYQPAQGYFTVNYPKEGLFKIGLIPAYGETTVDPSHYQIKIYDNTTKSWRDMDPDGEEISMNTVYFRVLAVEPRLDGAQHKAQIDIWFKPDGSDEWISAYSEIRANYAIIIPATN